MNQLQQQLQSLSQQMEQLRNSGEIAPDNTWIQKFYIPKNGKRYEYYRLMKAGEKKSKTGKIQGQVEKYLGKRSSQLYQHFKAAIERRNQLQKLQRMYQKLLAIYESDLVSQGSTKSGDSIDNIPELTKLSEQIAQLEENQKQLWSALNLIAEKLGYSLSVGKSTATS